MYLSECKPFYLNSNAVEITEAHYRAKYIGCWQIKDNTGEWTNVPIDTFYQPNADVEKGHSTYFGVFYSTSKHCNCICNAESAFSEPILGVLADDGEVLVSRYRHDYVSKGDHFVDGGRDYFRHSISPVVKICVNSGNFEFELLGDHYAIN